MKKPDETLATHREMNEMKRTDLVSHSQFLKHCRDNDKQSEQIAKLMPLVELIPAIEVILENQRAMSIVGKKVMKIIGVIASIIGLVYMIVKFWKEIK